MNHINWVGGKSIIPQCIPSIQLPLIMLGILMVVYPLIVFQYIWYFLGRKIGSILSPIPPNLDPRLNAFQFFIVIIILNLSRVILEM